MIYIGWNGQKWVMSSSWSSEGQDPASASCYRSSESICNRCEWDFGPFCIALYAVTQRKMLNALCQTVPQPCFKYPSAEGYAEAYVSHTCRATYLIIWRKMPGQKAKNKLENQPPNLFTFPPAFLLFIWITGAPMTQELYKSYCAISVTSPCALVLWWNVTLTSWLNSQRQAQTEKKMMYKEMFQPEIGLYFTRNALPHSLTPTKK